MKYILSLFAGIIFFAATAANAERTTLNDGWMLEIDYNDDQIATTLLSKDTEVGTIGIAWGLWNELNGNPSIVLGFIREDEQEIAWFMNAFIDDKTNQLTRAQSCYDTQNDSSPDGCSITGSYLGLTLGSGDLIELGAGQELKLVYQTADSVQERTYYTTTFDLTGSKKALDTFIQTSLEIKTTAESLLQ